MLKNEISTNNQIAREQPTQIEASAAALTDQYRIIRFNERVMIEKQEPYRHFVALHKDKFEEIAYPLLSGISRVRLNDVFAYIINAAPDLSHNGHLILFGNLDNPRAHLTAWDMNTLEIRSDILPDDCVLRSPHIIKRQMLLRNNRPLPLILSLAGGDEDVYGDIMQSLAPLVMSKKPYGVIWWIEGEENGKAMLMDALRRIFLGLLSSISMKGLIGGRNVLALKGKLGNIADCGDNQIENNEVYKNIGSHQNFRIHKFHSQRDIEIDGNVHHIFSASAAPAFKTKNHSTESRTHIIRFSKMLGKNRRYTLTDEFLSQLIAEMCRYAIRLKEQGYRYKWSTATKAASDSYDTESSEKETVPVGLSSSPPKIRW